VTVLTERSEVCISLPKSLLDELRAQAGSEEISVSQLARRYFRQGLADDADRPAISQAPPAVAGRR
jgi:hypothetical protein